MNCELKTDTFDLNKLKTSIFVNFIHHIDSSLLWTLIKSHRNSTLPIHDCLMVKPRDVEYRIGLAINAYIEIYNDNTFEKYLMCFYNITPDHNKEERIKYINEIKSIIGNAVLRPNRQCFNF